MKKTYTHIQEVVWNDKVKLVVADVDETIAGVYKLATPEMIKELELLLQEGKAIFFVTGAGLQSVRERITDLISPAFRKHILIGNCHGAELWGFTTEGILNEKPFYSAYEEKFNEDQKKQWREVMNQLIREFQLKIFPTMPPADFRLKVKTDVLSVMMVDRGVQITLEVVNAHNLSEEQVKELEKKLGIAIPLTNDVYDLRYALIDRAQQLFDQYGLPLYCKTGGTFALDFIVQGVDKTRTVKFVTDSDSILKTIGLTKEDIVNSEHIETWGDKYMGPDFLMSLAFPPEVRSIDFRDEDPTKLSSEYNIQLWKGSKRLHEGTLEYIQSRKKF